MKLKDEVKKILRYRKERIQLLRSRLKSKLTIRNSSAYQLNYLKQEKQIQNILELLD